MNSTELMALANELAMAGAPGIPTILLVQDAPILEVEFLALEFAKEAKLSTSNWAVLALARALGVVTPADADSYLGLGDAVCEALVRRLLDESLLEERNSAADAPSPQHVATEHGAFLRRRFRGREAPIEAPEPAPVHITAARKLCDSRASTAPTCILTAGGQLALQRGSVAQRRVRPMRLLFLAKPLLYLETVDERQHRFTQHRRARPLEPDRVPESFRLLDTALSLPPEERVAACGINADIGGFDGHLVGVVPGTQWEVRTPGLGQRGRRTEGNQSGTDRQTAQLILAGFPSSDEKSVHWRAFVRQQNHLAQDCPHIDAARLMDPTLHSFPSLLGSMRAEGFDLSQHSLLRPDGAFELRCEKSTLPQSLGEADRPHDAYVSAMAPGWWVGIRTHAKPADAGAARAAFFEFLSRHDSELRRNFDTTCEIVARALLAYFEENHELPSAAETAMELWTRPELRAALCMRRRYADLVEPYLDPKDLR